MDSSTSRLTRLQWEILEAFFERERGFFLTGDGALVGFHLRHRGTEDLDLFTQDASVFERGPHALADTVAALDAEMVIRQQAPGFHRYVVTRGDEAVVVDMVHDQVPQLHVEKLEQQGVRVDWPEEILVNKLHTIASRCEIRDLVDVMILEHAGFRVEDALKEELTQLPTSLGRS